MASSTVCNPSCNTTQIRTYPVPCDKRNSTRKGGFDQWGMIDCDQVLVDISDPVEWEALRTGGYLITSPQGFGSLIAPESTEEKLSACSPEEVIDEISGFEWYTVLFDNDAYEDFDFENDVKEKYASKTIFWVGCDGLLYYRYKWATGENPGFGNMVAKVYREGEPESLQKLHVDVKWNSYQDGLKAIPLTQALKDAIFG